MNEGIRDSARSGRFLDFIAPVEARVRQLLWHQDWAKRQAQSGLGAPAAELTERLPESPGALRRWAEPRNWQQALAAAGLLVLVPQLVLFLAFWLFGNPMATSVFQLKSGDVNIGTLLLTAWQVLAAVIGVAFVIVVLLIESFNSRMFESRAMPMFVRKTGMLLVIFVELLTLLSIGLNALLLSDNALAARIPATLVAWNFVLFAMSIVLTMSLYVRVFTVIKPSRMRQLQYDFQREAIAELVKSESIARLTMAHVRQHFIDRGIEFEWFPPSERPGLAPLRLRVASGQRLRIDDVNLAAFDLASSRVQSLLTKPVRVALAVCVHPAIAWTVRNSRFGLVAPEADRPQVTELLQMAVRLKPAHSDVEDDLRESLAVTRKLLVDAIRDRDRQLTLGVR
jgi:hypothetical protein